MLLSDGSTRMISLLAAAVVLAAPGALPAIPSGASQIENADLPQPPFDSGLACYNAVKPGEDTLAVDGVFQLVKNPDRSIAAEAVDVLARLNTPDARAALSLVMCASTDAGLRARAADRFGDHPDAESVWVLAIALDNEKNAEVRDVLRANLERAAATQPDPWKDVGEPRAYAAAARVPAARRAPRGHRRPRP